MTTLAMVSGWDDWEVITSGDGVVTPNSDNSLVTLSASTASTAYLLKRIPANPGETIKFSVVANHISGNPQIGFDYIPGQVGASLVSIDKTDVSRYEVEYTVPYTSSLVTSQVKVTAGVYTSPEGSAALSLPSISVTNSPQGFVRSYCLGLVRLTRAAGVVTATINTNFTKTGIKSVDYSAATKRLTVTIQKSAAIAFLRPIFDAGMTMDLLPKVNAKAGQYDEATGTFKVQFNDGSADWIDIAASMSDGEIAYCWVRAGGI
jgi:hypothetical protein